MSEEYGANFITVTDEEGNEFELSIWTPSSFRGRPIWPFSPLSRMGKKPRTRKKWAW